MVLLLVMYGGIINLYLICSLWWVCVFGFEGEFIMKKYIKYYGIIVVVVLVVFVLGVGVFVYLGFYNIGVDDYYIKFVYLVL